MDFQNIFVPQDKRLGLRCRFEMFVGLSHLTQPENQMKSGLLLDIVVSQRATILQLLAGENESLKLIWNISEATCQLRRRRSKHCRTNCLKSMFVLQSNLQLRLSKFSRLRTSSKSLVALSGAARERKRDESRHSSIGWYLPDHGA